MVVDWAPKQVKADGTPPEIRDLEPAARSTPAFTHSTFGMSTAENTMMESLATLRECVVLWIDL